jgi:hypothetical protein
VLVIEVGRESCSPHKEKNLSQSDQFLGEQVINADQQEFHLLDPVVNVNQ